MAVFTVGDDITAWANHLGLDPTLCLADFWSECGGNVHAQGDYENGVPTSFGPFQLHKGGELGDLTPAQAENINTACSIALGHFAAVKALYPSLTGGALAAAAQRPADPTQYAIDVDDLIAAINSGHFPEGYEGAINAPANVPHPFAPPPPPLPVPKGLPTAAQLTQTHLVYMPTVADATEAVMNGYTLWYFVEDHPADHGPFYPQIAGKPTGERLYARDTWQTKRHHA